MAGPARRYVSVWDDLSRPLAALPPASSSNLAHDHQDHDNQENKSQAAGWPIPPIAAVAPVWQGADEDQNEDNHKNRAEHDSLHEIPGNNSRVMRKRQRSKLVPVGMGKYCLRIRIGPKSFVFTNVQQHGQSCTSAVYTALDSADGHGANLGGLFIGEP